jgi:1,4-alpha-glucan branching enzyme
LVSCVRTSILANVTYFSTYVTSRTISNAASNMLGANLAGDSCDFRVWAPSAKSVTLRLINDQGSHDWPMQFYDGFFTLQAFARPGEKYS